MGCLHQNIFTRKVTDIAFTSDFCNNYSHPASPTSLCLTSPRPRPTRPRVPYLMSSSPSSRVPKSQVPTHASRCPRPLVPDPLLHSRPSVPPFVSSSIWSVFHTIFSCFKQFLFVSLNLVAGYPSVKILINFIIQLLCLS